MTVPTFVSDKENTNRLDMTVAENKVQEHMCTFMKQCLEFLWLISGGRGGKIRKAD